MPARRTEIGVLRWCDASAEKRTDCSKLRCKRSSVVFNTVTSSAISSAVAGTGKRSTANSVRHSDAAAGRQIELEVEFDADFVKIEVCDAGSGYERRAVRRRPVGHDGGFGLLLVAELSDAWGVSGNGGTCAWALLDRTKAPPSSARDAARLDPAPR